MFKNKKWSEAKGHDAWSIFKIMAEFVEGYERLAKTGPCVSIFGSKCTPQEDPYYKLAEDIAAELVKRGYGVITGGGSGIMEASNKGAQEAGGPSVGLCINLSMRGRPNDYVDAEKLLDFDYFFVRKVMFLKYSQGFIVMPGGLGTLDELFEALTLIQTKKVRRFPLVLVKKSYWQGLIDWLKKTVYEEKNYIQEEDWELINIVDTKDEAVEVIDAFYAKYRISPNF
ncbi:MAG: TIGR00730 family Rossman fold protein [Cytophagales bacterium]|nr:TIGR00730 family Rossman fold protein [Cytophagales bacterium]